MSGLKVVKTISEAKNLEILSISEVAERLKKKDNTATKKWLERRGVRIYAESKSHYVYEIDLAVELDKPWVRSLIHKYPDNWKDIYRGIAKDKSVCDLVLLSLGEEINYLPKTKVKKMDENDKKLFKKLTV